MKNIAAQMVNFDREQMRRIANNMPEQYDEKPQVQQVAQIINGVFSQLLATFPASLANRDQNELNEIRRQWVLAFRENGITTMEQVNAGMRVAVGRIDHFCHHPGSLLHGAGKKHPLSPDCQTSASWLIWFTVLPEARPVSGCRVLSVEIERALLAGYQPVPEHAGQCAD